EVTKRRNPRVAGVIQKKRKGAWLDPDDSRLRGPILLSGDHSAARDGDAAVIDIVRFPQFADELAEGQIVEVLGTPGDPRTDLRSLHGATRASLASYRKHERALGPIPTTAGCVVPFFFRGTPPRRATAMPPS